jgi:putative glutathione S-transferase
MGLLVDGAWKEDVPRAKDGHFVRPATAFHNYITPDGSPGPTGKGGFPAEAGRTSTSRWPVRGRPAP